jgi:hypothetical protein
MANSILMLNAIDDALAAADLPRALDASQVYTDWRKAGGFASAADLARLKEMKTRYRKLKYPHRITIDQWCLDNGYNDVSDAQDLLQDSVMPALCDEGCSVEPDGRCAHGCPSPLIAMGMI